MRDTDQFVQNHPRPGAPALPHSHRHDRWLLRNYAMTTRLRRSIATFMAVIIDVQTSYTRTSPVQASAPLIRLASPVPGAAASPAPVARRALRQVARALTGAGGYAGGVVPVFFFKQKTAYEI